MKLRLTSLSAVEMVNYTQEVKSLKLRRFGDMESGLEEGGGVPAQLNPRPFIQETGFVIQQTGEKSG